MLTGTESRMRQNDKRNKVMSETCEKSMGLELHGDVKPVFLLNVSGLD